MSEAIQKNVGTIALIVAIIALVSSLVPQINELRRDFALRNVQEEPVGRHGGAPGGMGPGGMGGPGMMRGFGPSKETTDKFSERLSLYDEALKNANGEDLLRMRVERDAVKLMTLRIENGSRRIAPGLSEALLKMRAALACPKASALEKNQAEIEFCQQMDRMRGDREAFMSAAAAFKDYPNTPASDGDLENLLAAELQR